MAGFDAGVRYGTHLFNAMPPLAHRDPGLPGALLTDDRDRPSGSSPMASTRTRRSSTLVWRTLGSRRLSLVTDAMAALGMPARQAPARRLRRHGGCDERRLADRTLAGSILALDQAVRNLLDITGCSLAEAFPTITTTPAKLLGLDGERGRIAPGLHSRHRPAVIRPARADDHRLRRSRLRRLIGVRPGSDPVAGVYCLSTSMK